MLTPAIPFSCNTIFVTLMTSIPNYLSACNRHPTVSITGFCSFCLHERLAGFHSSPTSSDSTSPDHHHSCEIQVRNSLSDLISLADERIDLNQKPENSGLQFMEAEHAADDDDEEETVTIIDEVDKETMTMKEFIDLESQIRNKHIVITDLRSFRDAVNAISEKLRKWKWKHKLTKNRNGNDNANGIGECSLRRRSCDANPTSSSMESRRGSVDWPRGLIGRAFLCSCSCQCPCSRVSPTVSVMEESNNIDNQKMRRVLNGGRSSESVMQKLVRSYSLSCRIRMIDLVNDAVDNDQRRGRQEFMFYLARLKSYRRSKSANSSSSNSI